MMWAEARKQEKKLRGMMVDHKRRAERRREYYEKIKQDPTQFLQVHGRPVKIHIDPTIAAAADGPGTMMPWQGQKEVMIDRFDVRAHLDFIPEYEGKATELGMTNSREDRETNYERYRILVQNDFLKVPEEKFLRTIDLEERFGGKTYQNVKAKEDKKKHEKSKAAIGFIYEDSTPQANPVPDALKTVSSNARIDNPQGKNDLAGDEESDSDSEMDLDMTVDIMALGTEQQIEINKTGKSYFLGKEDFIRFLARDIEEAEELKAAKQEEEEKAMYSGRKSRRERRMLREKRLLGRKISPPSYAARSSPTYERYRRSDESRSRSTSPEDDTGDKDTGKVEFITSFGVDSDEGDHEPATKSGGGVSDQARSRLKRLRQAESPDMTEADNIVIGPQLPSTTSSSKPRDRRRNSRERRSRSRSRDRRPRRSRSRDRRRSRSHHRNDERRRDRSRSRDRGRRYRSPPRRPRRRSRSRDRGSRRSPVRKMRTPSPQPPSKVSKSDSDSSSSDEDTRNPNRYRSKYRQRRRSSSSSSSDNGKPASPQPTPSVPPIVRPQNPNLPLPVVPPPPVIKRYYGRRKEDRKSESESESDGDDRGNMKSSDSNNTNNRNNGNQASSKGQSLTFKEKIRKRVQAQIKKQYKADKKAEEERRRLMEEERLFREEEMREMALRLKKRERGDRRASDDSSSDNEESKRRSHSRSGSHSPPRSKRPELRDPSVSPPGESRRDRVPRSSSRSPSRKLRLVDY